MGILDTFAKNDEHFSMVMEANRVNSFISWPYDGNCLCTAKKMARAGFYHCPTQQIPDLARCYSCLIELDSWDPDDDPWKEHTKHTIDKGRPCEFMKIGKPESEMSVGQFLETVKARHVVLVKKMTDQNLEDFDKKSTAVRESIMTFGKSALK